MSKSVQCFEYNCALNYDYQHVALNYVLKQTNIDLSYTLKSFEQRIMKQIQHNTSNFFGSRLITEIALSGDSESEEDGSTNYEN